MSQMCTAGLNCRVCRCTGCRGRARRSLAPGDAAFSARPASLRNGHVNDVAVATCDIGVAEPGAERGFRRAQLDLHERVLPQFTITHRMISHARPRFTLYAGRFFVKAPGSVTPLFIRCG